MTIRDFVPNPLKPGPGDRPRQARVNPTRTTRPACSPPRSREATLFKRPRQRLARRRCGRAEPLPGVETWEISRDGPAEGDIGSVGNNPGPAATTSKSAGVHHLPAKRQARQRHLGQAWPDRGQRSQRGLRGRRILKDDRGVCIWFRKGDRKSSAVWTGVIAWPSRRTRSSACPGAWSVRASSRRRRSLRRQPLPVAPGRMPVVVKIASRTTPSARTGSSVSVRSSSRPPGAP